MSFKFIKDAIMSGAISEWSTGIPSRLRPLRWAFKRSSQCFIFCFCWFSKQPVARDLLAAFCVCLKLLCSIGLGVLMILGVGGLLAMDSSSTSRILSSSKTSFVESLSMTDGGGSCGSSGSPASDCKPPYIIIKIFINKLTSYSNKLTIIPPLMVGWSDPKI